MKQVLSAQQLSHYTKSKSIELELPHPKISKELETDGWKKSPELLVWIKKKLGPVALALAGTTQMRLGLTKWYKEDNKPKNAISIKNLISLQKPLIAAAFSDEIHFKEKTPPLGILPSPSEAKNILFFDPNLILNWSFVTSDIFVVVFTSRETIYIENPKDSETNYLKKEGYFFGDPLSNQTHPLIVASHSLI